MNPIEKIHKRLDRLAATAFKRVYLEDQICVYVGSNKTILGVYNSRGDYCATSMDCLYKPNSEKTVSRLLRDFLDKAKDDATK